jgi:hypothetical protein
VELFTIDPLTDNRWDDLVARHPRASAFHQRGWLEALAATYGYEPYALTSAPAGEPLTNAVVLCRVSSWITGSRLVALPFADHCDFLTNDHEESLAFANRLRTECDRQRWKYVEVRPLSRQSAGSPLRPTHSYYFHELDITSPVERLFGALHRNSIQRKIRRAEREKLVCEVGSSEELLDEFYRLLLITRRRLQMLPQPRLWFKNLIRSLGDTIEIRLARKNGIPIASILTLRHRSSIIYKYGCSDEKVHNLGGMPFLFWRMIEDSKAAGLERIDFGRSDLNGGGLVTFKDRFGTAKTLLTYYRYQHGYDGKIVANWNSPAVRRVFSVLPNAVCSMAGRLLYRHVG